MAFVTQDSVAYLQNRAEEIDFLYLDSLDFDPFNPGPSQAHALEEAKVALSKMTKSAVIMIDDVDLPKGRKGGLVIPYLENHGWHKVYTGYQVIMERNH